MVALIEEKSAVEMLPAENAVDPARWDAYKRPMDLVILLAAFVFAFPLWLLLGTVAPLVIWLTDRGPVFYTQARMGKDGRIFRIIKFRTMIVGAENGTGPVWASRGDGRITRFGRFLRRTHLDEFPQLINVLRGEMSLVGPRPERPELAQAFSEKIPQFHQRLRVRPGIAGLAQVRGRYDTSPRNKLRYDKIYIRNLCPWMDFKLFVQSIWVAFAIRERRPARRREESSRFSVRR